MTWETINIDRLSALYMATFQGYTIFKTVWFKYCRLSGMLIEQTECYQAKLTGTYKQAARASTLSDLFNKLGLTSKEQTLFT